jgi:hypothetical protein
MTAFDESGMVPLRGGFRVPGRFTIRLRGRARRTPVEVEAAVEMIDGKAHMRGLAIVAGDTRPLSAADLSALDLVQIFDSAVQQAALAHTPMEWKQAPGDDAPVPLPAFTGWVREQQAADAGAALTAARSARDRRRITDSDLRRVLDIHAAKGIEGVMAELGYSERNARRLLARARKELA